MNYIDNKEKVINLVYRLCDESGVQVDHAEAQSTDSLYFWLRYRNSCVKFRISDHSPNHSRTKASTRSLTITKTSKRALVERFIRNRIKAVKDMSFRVTMRNVCLQNSLISATA